MEPDNRAGQRGGGEDQGVLDLSHQLVSDLLTEELCAVLLAAVLCVDVELPDKLQQLVHGAVGLVELVSGIWGSEELCLEPLSDSGMSLLWPEVSFTSQYTMT